LAFSETDNPVNIAIIGGGFCGVMTAVNLLRDNSPPLHIHLINKGYPLAKGVAYTPHTANLLLNVPNGRMSAFADEPNHYVNWLMKTNAAAAGSKDKLSAAFSTRQQYGNYLAWLWDEWRHKANGNKQITVYDDYADDIIESGPLLHISLRGHPVLAVDTVVLATGNSLPRLPAAIHPSLSKSKFYFADPWKASCIRNTGDDGDILIIGNGLTMVDTAIGLAAAGYKGTIHTISPHGYRLKPWQDEREPYAGIDFSALNPAEYSLLNLLKIFNRHRKIAERLNQSVYPLVDALRPKAQLAWQSFSLAEKQQFIKYLNTFWGSIRHRLPAQMQEIIDAMRANGKLITHKGYVTGAKENNGRVEVSLNCNGSLKSLDVQRVINCTGPETDITRPGNKLLNNLAKKGMISQGPCGLGISAQVAACCFAVADTKRRQHPDLFVIGANLKGMLWESTAVPELRLQAKTIAQQILAGVNARQGKVIIPV
jgi:uncharacterized NAD(P)/FAD-binding protein YdhS